MELMVDACIGGLPGAKDAVATLSQRNCFIQILMEFSFMFQVYTFLHKKWI